MSGFITIQAAIESEKQILCQLVVQLVREDRNERWAEHERSFWDRTFKVMREQHGSTVESQERLEREYDKLRAGAVEKYGQDADEKTYLRQRRETEQSSSVPNVRSASGELEPTRSDSSSTSGQDLASANALATALASTPQASDQSENQAGQNQ
ncbi:hypothetical protein AC578_9696 [Pseudocercospora eumusae]|uniref:Uncharacterized protein n=1 Tax=Pseudocercospora eumusae TaxID=321146 RepID=A0A139HQQ6_9PEZI|nr:hypothetical protein AC578_9696 [Pseudocercospora eumusae]